MKISEFEFIKQVKKNLATLPKDFICGIGEDCAVVKKDNDSVFLISTDCLIEKIHFDFKYFSFFELGKKALSVNLSDIAAMAGKPLYVFVTLGIPGHYHENLLYDFYAGLEQVSQEFGAAIIGGDTSLSRQDFFVSLTVIGVAKNDEYKLRSMARPGDGIYVSGPLGSAALGLKLLQKNKATAVSKFVQAHKNPRPRLYLSEILATQKEVHAVIDLSDGLLQDLQHILESSKVSAKILLETLPYDTDFISTCEKVKCDPEELLLAGGEDYQLLFTMDDHALASLQEKLNRKKIPIFRIGEIVSTDEKSPQLQVFKEDRLLSLKDYGFDHFKKSK